LFFQGTRQAGKLFVAAFGLDREHTSWPVHQTFIPFLDLALQTARQDDPTPVNFEPAEVAVVQLPPKSTVSRVVLRDDTHELGRFPVEQGRAQVRLPEQPGLYALSYDDRPQIEKVFSVNPSPKESQLAFVASPEARKSWQLARAANAPRGPAAPVQAKISLAGVLQQRWWWWMMIAGLAVLVLETILAESRKARA
jgi:hypothetical protein